MALGMYGLDQIAHDLVLEFRDTDALNQVHKMRTTAVYGLERFWGEHLRLNGHDSRLWKNTWEQLAEILAESGIKLPNDDVSSGRTDVIQGMATKLWDSNHFPKEQRQVALAVLIQLCDCMIWWRQRYKPVRNANLEDTDNA
ncbi:hypothetical protein IQ266_25675 [filamentous cyanobacterium LEGE 11480]|uniref:Uncharacterized protein n=1 Tax=Romeriopsis navalis LEGE 11480 TaxID=2777977 RepID=A0A928VSW4_9CYAN|nr:hypothetical protein [Romeriopsis navalis]MBE9033132.1 hypothetical protein [Romeriopsis navalis LEGE 11480]